MDVWISNGDKSNSHKRHYHNSATCYQLLNGVNRNKTTRIIKVDYETTFPLKPCSACAGGKVPMYFKPYCEICPTWRACPHNGGTPVFTKGGPHWVWPDRVNVHVPLVLGRPTP